MNLEEIVSSVDEIEKHYSVSMTEEQKKTQIEAVKYLYGFLKELSLNPANINPFDYFKSSTGLLYSRKDTIRKTVTEHYDKLKELTGDSADFKFNPSVKELFISKASNIADSKMNEIKKTERKISRARSNVSDYRGRIEASITDIGSFRERITQLEQTPSGAANFVNKVEKVLSLTDFYTIKESDLEAGYLTLITKDIVFDIKRPSSDNKLNLGPMYLKLKLSNLGDMRAGRAEGNNIVPSGIHPHPHLNSNTSICWGEVSSTVSGYVANSEIDKILIIFEQLMKSYNNGDPYITLDGLAKHVFKFKNCPACGQEKEIDIEGGKTRCRACGTDAAPIECDIALLVDNDGQTHTLSYSSLGSSASYKITNNVTGRSKGISSTTALFSAIYDYEVSVLVDINKVKDPHINKLKNTYRYVFGGKTITLTETTAQCFSIPTHTLAKPPELIINNIDSRAFVQNSRSTSYKLIPDDIKDLRNVRMMYRDSAMADFDGFAVMNSRRWFRTVTGNYTGTHRSTNPLFKIKEQE